MTSLRTITGSVRRRARSGAASVSVFTRDVGQGLLEVSHNTLALLGLAGVATTLFVATQADWRHAIEVRAHEWLQARHQARGEGPEPVAEPAVQPVVAVLPGEAQAIARATASDPRELTRQQGFLAHWISLRYRVAPEPISRLVKEAWLVGEKVGLDPTLILAIMAIESNFNPFAQSAMGAQGLMQVMTGVHNAKYQAFGGKLAAFDPVTNLRVGVLVLKECIARTGGVETGLRSYVGAANLLEDGGYAGKVLAEQGNMRKVASGKSIPVSAPLPSAVTKPKVEAAVEPPSAVTAPAPAAAADDAADDAKPAPEQVALIH